MILAVLIAGAVIASGGLCVGFIMGAAVSKASAAEHHKDCVDLTSDEMTMHKVYRALMDHHITKNDALDIVGAMGSAGILFRERVG